MKSTASDVKFVYDNEEAITAEVLERFDLTPDPRLRFILKNLIGHLHACVREVGLTSDEWEALMQFCATAAQWSKPPRNDFISISDALGVTMQVIASSQRKPAGATLPTLIGPFFVPDAPRFENGEDISNGAKGKPLYVTGRILDLQGRPISGAIVDAWHSDDRGLYDVQGDLEEDGMWARGQVVSDAQGRYSFWSIMPTAYPVPTDGALGILVINTTQRYYRPAHLHYAIRAKDFDPLVTHVFFRGDKYLDEDFAFGVRPALVTECNEHEPGEAPDGRTVDVPFNTLNYDFVLTRPGE